MEIRQKLSETDKIDLDSDMGSTNTFYMAENAKRPAKNILPKPKSNIYSKYIKRFLDFFICCFALLVLSPLLFIISILELCFHGRPILYTSMRPGKDCKMFKVYKFRSMTNKTDKKGALLLEKDRLTKFGKLLRRLSFDELPALFSIIKGDMSIVGPRPLLPEYLGLYSDYYNMRHSIRPGLACIKVYRKDEKRSNTWTWREQFENDIYYIQNISFYLDLQMILAITKEVLVGTKSRTKDTRIRFNGCNLDDTRTKQQAMMDEESVKSI
jgi:undecaprenyl phosphate N,N'-diacetylbacillosamine 1-phosphate transferase